MRLGTWVVTHVVTEGRVFFAAALSADRAREKTFLATGIPVVELNAVLIRYDEVDSPNGTRGLAMERFLGPLKMYSPRRRLRCPNCEGSGRLRGSPPPICSTCGGEGLRGDDVDPTLIPRSRS